MAQRLSPLQELVAPLNPVQRTVHGMQVATALGQNAHTHTVLLADASCLPRMGVKGAKAEAWLAGQGVSAPPAVNSWLRTPDGTLVARLARSEFFIEALADAGTVARLRSQLQPASGVTPVLRQDAALVLSGTRVHELLTQTCNINFSAYAIDARTVVMTSMVGVTVLVVWEPINGAPRYRLWCDHTFAPYLWETLMEIARELGGGATGLQQLLSEALDQGK